MRWTETKSESLPPKASAPVKAQSRFPAWLPAVFLALVTMALYWPATRHDFVNYDDNSYVTSNIHVQNGLTRKNIKWAFCNPVDVNWHPLTVLSHMLDCQIYGLRPWGHHLTNVLLHALNAALVLLLLCQLTGAMWRSLLVAALFAVHPQHVESVAWVAERKDVLSGFFGLLTLVFYVRYAQAKTQGAPCAGFYWLAFVFLACGLMSKAMLVTWPFVMLLLDYWPLNRFTIDDFRFTNFRPLLLEKIPFLVLATVASIVTFLVQKRGGAVAMVENLSIGARSTNALISYCRYLGKMFWPSNLAVFYPHPGHWPLAYVLLAGGFLSGVTAVCFMMRRHPFLLMGWLWCCGTLVPVIGLVQVGQQAMADRYTYIPSLGVLIAVIWGFCELTGGRRFRVMTLSVVGGAAVVVCMALTRQQLGYWKDSETLFQHALEVTKNNQVAHNQLGISYAGNGRIEAAIGEFQTAIGLKPNFPEAHNNLGNVLASRGQIDAAISQHQEAIRLKPDWAEAHDNLGTSLYKRRLIDGAVTQYQEAIRLEPDWADPHYNLGLAFADEGRIDEAIGQYQQALRLKPDYADAHNNLGISLAGKGQIDEAINQFRETVRLKPDFAEAHNNLGNVLASKGRFDEAISEYQESIHLKPDWADAHNNLGITLAGRGRLDEAINEYREAVRLKPDFAAARDNLARALEIKKMPAGQ